MPNLLFAMKDNKDPEERLEAALLWKALRDEFGDAIHPLMESEGTVPGDLIFGLSQKKQSIIAQTDLKSNYWDVEAFTSRLSRSFRVCNFTEAIEEVDRLNSEGKQAFVKALRDKFYTGRTEPGQRLTEHLGDMTYSFCHDDEPVLMIQEAVNMSHEYRCIIANGKVITASPVVHRATPYDRWHPDLCGLQPEVLLYASPSAEIRDFILAADTTREMRDLAEQIATESSMISGTIDLCLLDGDPNRIEPIEINMGWPGRYGLYFCEPREIARSSRAMVDPELLNPVRDPEAREPEQAYNPHFAAFLANMSPAADADDEAFSDEPEI